MASSEPGYERLGAKILALPDVIAQSVGFMGPVFSSAFVIPLVVGVISASGKGGGVASPISVLIAAVGVFALGWMPRLSPALARASLGRKLPGWSGSGFGGGLAGHARDVELLQDDDVVARELSRVLSFSAQSLRRSATRAATTAMA